MVPKNEFTNNLAILDHRGGGGSSGEEKLSVLRRRRRKRRRRRIPCTQTDRRTNQSKVVEEVLADLKKIAILVPRQYYTLVEQKVILLIFISIIDRNINFRSK